MTDARPSRSTVLVLAVMLLTGAAVIMRAGHDLTFFYDEWDFVLRRRGISFETFLTGHNGHLVMVPVAIYKLLLQVFGLHEYWPYRLTLVAIHAIAVTGLFAVIRRRAGDGAALLAAALLMFLGAASDDLLWSFQIGFVGSMAAGLWMLVALDRNTPRADVVASLLLLVTLGSSSLGITFAVVAFIEPIARREWRRLGRIALVPLVLYGVWRLAYGESDLRMANVDDAPSYVFQMLASGAGGLTGIPATGVTLAVAGIAGIGGVLARGRVTPRLGALLAGLLSLLVLTALARAQNGEPGATRYIYATAVLLLLVAAEVWQPGFRLRGRTLAVATAAVLVALVGNLLLLNQGATGLRSTATSVRLDLAALELARNNVSPAYQPLPQASPQINAGDYLSARDAFGSAAFPMSTIVHLPNENRLEVDRVLTEIDASFRPVNRPKRLQHCAAVPARSEVPVVPGRTITIVAPTNGATEVRVRRYADTFPPGAYAVIPAGGAGQLAVRPDRSSRPWTLQIGGGGAACVRSA